MASAASVRPSRPAPARVALACALALALSWSGAGLAPTPARAAEIQTELSEPVPGFDQPRRIMLQLTTDDEREVNSILWNAINLQKFYGMDNVEIAIVAYGFGMSMLYRDSPVADRIASQIKYGIRFIACGNTMETTGHTPDELVDGVDWVQAGIAEMVERQLRGWVTVSP
jgi:intracellular sulfur oxidation DsrE/DsrF family protein